MKKFVLKLTLLTAPIIGVAIILFLNSLDNRNFDAIYPRLAKAYTSDGLGSVILGTSRSAQILDSRYFEPDTSIFNLSFTINRSDFNPAYYRMVTSAIDSTIKGKKYALISVDPLALRGELNEPQYFDVYPIKRKYWSLAKLFFFKGLLPAKLIQSWFDPNPKYDMRPKGRLIVNLGPKEAELHEERRLPVELAKTRNSNRFQWNEWNPEKEAILIRFIQFFDRHGYDVFLIRLPTSKPRYELELGPDPTFDQRISSIAKSRHVGYIELGSLSGAYLTNDGNHLWHENDKEIMTNVLDSISAH